MCPGAGQLAQLQPTVCVCSGGGRKRELPRPPPGLQLGMDSGTDATLGGHMTIISNYILPLCTLAASLTRPITKRAQSTTNSF